MRAKPEAGKIIATTLDYPMVMDTFGCTPKFLAENPKAAKALADGYFDAVAMIKAEPKKSFEIMGADVKQTRRGVRGSQKYLRWQDRAANQKFFAGEHAAFSKEAADLLLEAGIIKQIPDLTKLADTRSSSEAAGAAQVDSRDDAARRRSRRRTLALGIAFFVALRRGVGGSRPSAASCRRPSSPTR